FVPLLALTTIFAFAMWCFVSHVFVSVTEETAAGNEVIVWDDSGFVDYFREGIFLGWLVGVWVVPASLVAGWPPHRWTRRSGRTPSRSSPSWSSGSLSR